MKIKVLPKVSHKTPLCTTLYTTQHQNNYFSSNPTWVFWATFLTNKITFFTNKTILTHFILIKT